MQQLPRPVDHRLETQASRKKSRAGLMPCWLKPRARWPSFHHPPRTPARRAERFAFREFAAAVLQSQKSVVTSEERELELKVELGRTQVCSDDLAELRRGSVVSLDRSTSEPADIVLNGHIVARGEVLVLDGNFCVRVTELMNLGLRSEAA